MAIGKKGVLLTLIAITIITLFTASYTTYTLYTDRGPINSRITTLNNFVASVEQDLPRQVYISGYRAIFLFNRQIIDTGNYMPDIETSFSELFFNGTLNGVSQDIMTDATFSRIEQFFLTGAQRVNANLTIQNPTISISQSDPWNIDVILNANLIINDINNLATWNKSISTTTKIPISNFDDPIYAINTQGKILNKVKQTSYQPFLTGTNYTNLTNHLQNSRYITSTSAPNFIMRLEGNLSSSPTGIESLVSPQTLANVGISTKYKSLVDYIYFSDLDPEKYSIPTVTNLILDNQSNHLATYNVSEIAILI